MARSKFPTSAKDIVKKAKPYTAAVGVYFLIYQEEIVYVGQSNNVHTRVASHQRDGLITFDSWHWFACPLNQLLAVENYYIQRLRPRMNANLMRSNKQLDVTLFGKPPPRVRPNPFSAI